MINLFIDTSSSDVSIAIIRDNKLIDKITQNIPNKHSIYTVSYIDQLIKKCNLNPKDINKIYVVNGPGSFTGIRIGVTIAKIYAYLSDIKIVPISSLKQIAISDNNKLSLSILKANSNNYYIGLYDNEYNEIIKEQFASTQEVKDIINKYNPKIISNTDINIENIEIKKIDLDIEKIIKYYENKEEYNCHNLLPNYLKLPQALEDRK